MGAAPNRHDADAVGLGHGDRLGHGPGRDHEAEAVLPVDAGRDGRDALRLQLGMGVDKAAPETVEIARQAHEAMRVDAAQIRPHQTIGDDVRIALGQAARRQEPARERLRRLRRHINHVAFGFRVGLALINAHTPCSSGPTRCRSGDVGRGGSRGYVTGCAVPTKAALGVAWLNRVGASLQVCGQGSGATGNLLVTVGLGSSAVR
jgi:hypothetical protein